VRVHKGTTYPAQWDAIISTERHAQVVAVLNGHVNKAIGTAPKHLLSGILRCGRCGHAVRVVKHSGRAYYTCPPKIEGGCAGVSVSGAGADAYVTECVLGGNPRSRRIDAAASDAGRPVLYVDGKLDQLRQRRFEMASAFADGLVALDLFTLTVNSLDKQITAAEQRQAEVANARVAAVQADHISYRWDTLTLDEKRAAIRQAVVEIKLVPAFSSAPTFDPRRVVVTWPEVDAVPAVFGWWAAGAEQTA
jgi:site-specific DNA recombinase